MQFGNKDELKEAIREYAIVQGRNVKLVKNDNKRIQAKCAGHTKCPFILFASKIDRDEQTFSIKTLPLEHECTRVDKLKYTNSRWLSKKFADKIRKNPEWDVGAFQSERGFLARCRPLIGIDGCHLNGPYTGQVLTAVGVDGNNGMYPVAYVVVEVESKSSWIWFLELLIEDLKIENGKAWVFMSDKQKGLIPAIKTLLPTAEHKIFKRQVYLNMSRKDYSLYHVKDANRRIAGTVWRHLVGPRIVKIIEKNKLGASQCIPRLEGESKYQVSYMYEGEYVVDLKAKTCSCRRWNLCGIPCSHAISCILRKEANVFDYAHECYKKEAYLSSYEPMVHPIPSMDQWQRTNWPPIKPPPYKKQP
ncbi:PREDICTED: uncharacterized protein LOC103334793 [Prunus mume]|uniref:Uncharacterized protein LOC103334793 n=1 Tax=Prunus mume TaxID=102107 RepID=A0ABM1LJ20_PRUMU|nr:PREDICTED: uncharacterized protein LOC103334793 [Prunus mume]